MLQEVKRKKKKKKRNIEEIPLIDSPFDQLTMILPKSDYRTTHTIVGSKFKHRRSDVAVIPGFNSGTFDSYPPPPPPPHGFFVFPTAGGIRAIRPVPFGRSRGIGANSSPADSFSSRFSTL